MDGTLGDTMPSLRAAYEAFVRRYGGQPSDEEFERVCGPSIPQIAAILRESHGIPLETGHLAAEYEACVHAAQAQGIEPMPGAGALVDTLADNGYRLALVTSSIERVARLFLNAMPWRNRFELLIFGDAVPASKPDPAIYRLALERAGAPREQAAVLEDSRNGVAAAKAAGLFTIGFAPYGDGAVLQDAGCDRLVTALADVPAVLEHPRA